MVTFDSVRRVDEGPALESIEYLQKVIDAAGGQRPWEEHVWRSVAALVDALERTEKHLARIRRWNVENANFRATLMDAELEDGMLFGLGPIEQIRPRGLSKGADLTARRRAEIERGGNPATHMPLLRVEDPDNRATCGNCAHLYKKPVEARDTFWKCAQAPRREGEAGPDVRKSWPACTLFVQKGPSK